MDHKLEAASSRKREAGRGKIRLPEKRESVCQTTSKDQDGGEGRAMVCITGRSIKIWYQMGDSPEIRSAHGGDWERLLVVIHHLRHC
jgi:hypothetical protein